MNQENNEPPLKDAYDYLLFDVISKGNEQPIDDIILKSFFKKCFLNILDQSFNIIYPVKDNKCYFCSTESQCSRVNKEFIKQNGLIKTRYFDIVLFNYVNTHYVIKNFLFCKLISS
jgi:hypothetical protein